MQLISLTPYDLATAALLVLLLAFFSWRLRIGIEQSLLVAAVRTVIQLSLLGLVLQHIFNQTSLALIGIMTLIMLTVAGYEVMARQSHRFKGWWSMGIGTSSMFLSSFSITLLCLLTIIQVEPWYTPQYLIPLLGMMLGNTMNGIAIALNTLTRMASEQKGAIEAQLMLGHSWQEAILPLRREALKSGLIPIINSMTTAGIVSLPGMMTGQILAGSAPGEAARYQILIMFLIAAGTGLGSLTAVWLGSAHLFDDRERLRIDRLS